MEPQAELTNLKGPAERQTFFSNFPGWIMNTFFNIPLLVDPELHQKIITMAVDEVSAIRLMSAAIRQVREVPGANEAKDTLVMFGSGPSAAQYAAHLPWIFRHCYTIAPPTALPWLAEYGCYPDVVFNVDKHPILAEYVAKSGAHQFSNLVCPTEVSPKLPLLFGRDRTYWFKTSIGEIRRDPETGAAVFTEPFSVFMTTLLAGISKIMTQQGCVNNVMMLLAQTLKEDAGWNWKQAVLIGWDYGFWNDLGRLPMEGKDPRPWAETDGKGMTDPAIYRGYGAPEGGVKTRRRMIRYKAGAMLNWMRITENHGFPLRLYSMSHGILTEFPSVTPEQMTNGDWPEYLSVQGVVERASAALHWFQKNYVYSILRAEELKMQEEGGYEGPVSIPGGVSGTGATVSGDGGSDAGKGGNRKSDRRDRGSRN